MNLGLLNGSIYSSVPLMFQYKLFKQLQLFPVCSSFSGRAFVVSLRSSVLSVELFVVCAALPSVYFADECVGWLAIVSPQMLYNVLL
jgi:hypothetical protein